MSELFDLIAGLARSHARIYQSTFDLQQIEEARLADAESKQTISNKEIPTALAEDLELRRDDVAAIKYFGEFANVNFL